MTRNDADGKKDGQESTLPRTFSSGTSQFSKMSSHVSLPLMPSLSSFCAVLKPCMPQNECSHTSLSVECNASCSALLGESSYSRGLHESPQSALQVAGLRIRVRVEVSQGGMCMKVAVLRDDMNKPVSQVVHPPSCPSR